MTPAGFEPAIPACERPQTHALDRAATGIGTQNISFLTYQEEISLDFAWHSNLIAQVSCYLLIECSRKVAGTYLVE